MITINKVKTYHDKNIIEIKDHLGNPAYVCCICGRISHRKIKAYKKCYCNKHYRQIKKYGKPLDDNPRTIYDRNEIRINGDIAIMNLYNKNAEKIDEVIIDTDDVNKVKYIKWKTSASGYAVNSSKSRGSNIQLSRVILDTDQFVDHKNHNTLDNRKENLRIVTRSQNQMNVNYKGVNKTNNNKFYAHIKLNQKMINLGVYIYEEEAFFARWYAEKILFKEYAYPKDKPVILPDREEQIKEYVNNKVQRL